MILVKNQQQLYGDYILDKFGNLIKSIWYDGSVTSWEYDKFGNEIKLICSDGRVKYYKYDKFGNKL